MLPDYRGAMAVSEERLAIATSTNRRGRERHSTVERFDVALEAKFHEYRDRWRTHQWHLLPIHQRPLAH